MAKSGGKGKGKRCCLCRTDWRPSDGRYTCQPCLEWARELARAQPESRPQPKAKADPRKRAKGSGGNGQAVDTAAARARHSEPCPAAGATEERAGTEARSTALPVERWRERLLWLEAEPYEEWESRRGRAMVELKRVELVPAGAEPGEGEQEEDDGDGVDLADVSEAGV